jgi:hypothetical protein
MLVSGYSESEIYRQSRLFMTNLPPRSILTVTLRPKDKSKNLSLYGYQIASGKSTLPEDLQSCVTSEAEHKWDYPKKAGLRMNQERSPLMPRPILTASLSGSPEQVG